MNTVVNVRMNDCVDESYESLMMSEIKNVAGLVTVAAYSNREYSVTVDTCSFAHCTLRSWENKGLLKILG